MKALFFSIPLFFILLLAGQPSFCATGGALGALTDTFNHQKLNTSSTNHTTVVDIVVPDIEEETHSGDNIGGDNTKSFAVKAIRSGFNLHTVVVNSIVALQAAPVFVTSSTRIPTTPIYLSNRVLRL